MEANDSYSFPLYHRIGQVARPVIAPRYWIVIVLIAAILLYTPFLFSGFFQDDYGFRLNFSPEAYEKLNVPEEVILNSPVNLYGFSSGGSTRFAFQLDLRPDKDQLLPALILTDVGLGLQPVAGHAPADAHSQPVVVLPADPSGLPVVPKHIRQRRRSWDQHPAARSRRCVHRPGGLDQQPARRDCHGL